MLGGLSQITAAALPQYFNSDNSEATFDTRSDDKGPEPEAVVVGQVDGKHYAFVGLERVGGMMVYNISNPQVPEFVTYYNSRDFSADIAGDVAPEGLKFIPAADSPTGNPLLLAACEVSGTVAVYEVTGGGQPEGWDLTVMHTNDTHAHLDNIAHRATAVNTIRADVENSLLLDAGDVFSGTLYFTQFQGQADLELMNLLGYDAMGLGNHEFDKGPEGLAKFITGNYPEGYKTPAQFPVVNANFDFSNEPVLKDLAHTTVGEQGADNLDGQIYPAVVLDVNGEKVGVIGVTTEETAFISSPGDNIEINDAFEAAGEAVDMLESKGINKIVAISHLGWDRDLQLAEEVEGIDIVVGGHSHTKPDPYPALVDKDSTPTVVVQAKDHGEFLGRLDVTFDDHGVIISSVGSLLAVKDYAADAATSARLAEYAAVLDDFKTTVVGSTQVALDGLRANVRTKETNLGNLIADAMLAKASGTGATIAITNAGGIRASIDEGDITLGEVLTVMPFGNTLKVLELTGEQIVAALENGVSKVPAQEGRFPQVAGLKFVYDPAQPENNRIKKLTGIRYEKDAAGNIKLVKLGGTYDAKTRTFTFYTDRFSFYGVLKASHLINIYLTVDKLNTTVNGLSKTIDVAPTLINNRTMVPIRFVSESMGAKVDWEDATGSATITLDGKELKLVLNRLASGLDTPPVLVNGRILVPIRYVSESLGANVMWFPATNGVQIVK